MSNEDFLKSAGIWPEIDRVGLWRWRVSAEVQPRIRRFSAFILEFLASSIQDTGTLAARLVGLDGVPPRSLHEIRRQCVVPYFEEDNVMLEWEELAPPRTERRVLSRLTAAVWPTTVNESGAIACITPLNLVSELADFLDACAAYKNLSERAMELERDALCWWYQSLSAPLFAHQTGLQVMSAVPRSALARRCRKLAVIHPATDGENVDDLESDLGFTAELVDSTSSSGGGDRSPVVLQQGIDLMTTVGQEVDGMTKRRWAQSLFDLQSRAQATGPTTSLLLAWGLDLCENGTSGQSNLARSTVSHYFRRAAMPLFEALRLMKQKGDSSDWSTEDMHGLYVTLIAAQSIGNKKTTASALTSFQNFLTEWFDLEPMAMRLHDDVPMARVDAQIIWPHELDLIITWLQQVDDGRVRNAALIMVAIAREAPTRTNELLRLRLANIREGQDELGPYMEVEIARHVGFARLKTPAAQRRLTIRDPATIALIKSWVERRTDEGAPIDSYLFGDPNNDSRLHRPGAVVSLINRLLKAATGEPDARMHWLRHGAINRNVGGHLDSASTTDLNRIAIAATAAGHASAVSTFKSYFHLYEASLRTYLNGALVDLIKVTSAQAAPHLNLKSNTLRQHASRNSMQVEEYIWSQLRQMPITQPFTDVEKPYGWQEPVMPKLLPRANLAVTVAVARSWLEELLDGAGAEVLALRFGIAPETLEKMTRDTMSFCLHLARSAWPRRFTVQSQPPADLGHALGMAEIDLARAHQTKFRRLEDWFSTEQPLPVLRDAHASWLACRQGGHIALGTGGQILGLYQLLASAQVDPRDLRLCIQASLDAAGQQQPLKASQKVQQELARAAAIGDFMTVFGVAPRESLQQARLGRPHVYLQWDDPEHRQEPSSASSSCAGLDSWMCAAAILLSMKEGQS